MLRKPLSWSVRQVCSMINKGTITFDNPLQRPSNQWKIENKSLLIHSILTMFMPDIYAIQFKNEETKTNIYDIIDGKQRLTTIFSFLNDEWVLTDLKSIKLESTGEQFDISGKKFSELPEEVQEEIKGYTITFKAIELEEDDDEEEVIEDIFYRLNNGAPVSRGHLAFISTKRNVQEFVSKTVTENSLFINVAHFPEGSIKKSNRNNRTESIRVPIHCIDLIKDLSTIKDQSVQDTFIEVLSEWIMYKQKDLINNKSGV